MAFTLLAFYIAAIFTRLHEVNSPDSDSHLIRNLIILTFAFYAFFQKDKVLSIQVKALFALCAVISLSSVFNGWTGGAIHLMVEFLPTAFLPLVVVSGLITSVNKQHTIMAICLIAALFMVHNGYTQHISPDNIGWTGTKSVEGLRITYMGIFGDPNDLGMFLVMTLPFAFYFRSFGGFFVKHISSLIVIALLYGVYMTNSRGALLGILSLLSFHFYLEKGLKQTVITGVFIIPLVSIIMSKFRAIEQGASANGRVEAWYQGFQMLKMGPLFGVGKGNFTEYNQHTAHNSFILVLAELGTLGYMAWSVILGTSLYTLYRITSYGKKHPDIKSLSLTAQREIAIGKTLLFSMLGFMTTTFFLSRSYTILFFVFCGMAVASYTRASKVIPEITIDSSLYVTIQICKYSLLSIIFLYLVTKVLI
jgi:putative inorganic carbon (HCO3(-)) transporter